MSNITITLPDGSARELPQGATGTTLASEIGPGLAKAAVVLESNGRPVDLNAPLEDGASVRFLTDRDAEVLEHLRHSTAHVLAQAVLELWPGATFAGGPPIEDGFYYDFELPGGATFSDADLEAIEAKMREIIAADQPFERFELPLAEAKELMAAHPYKQSFMDLAASGDDSDGEVAGGEVISFYRNTPEFVDMCRGPHVASTGKLGHFKLMRVAGAYFRGSEKNPMLQRIYGTAWATKKELAAHLNRLEEAAKRDHRKLAHDLDLLSWPEELGPGLAVWHPKGALARKQMEDYSRTRHERGGYEFVVSPHIAKSVLWETSGHLDFYADGMYPPMELDGASYYPKPMNCPFHIMVYRSQQRSYRELPLRLFELGAVYRYELSGAVHGLMRSRGFTQDDSHIFTTIDDVPSELASLLDFVLDVLRSFGFDEFQAKLSTRPPEKAVGEDALWDMATDGLRSALVAHDIDYIVDEGGGAFYGPKIDVDVKDAIGRSWQLSTIQLDFNLPERFGLEYIASDGTRQRPVMIHRALFGSVERFFGVLLEHYAGAFPTWMAPVQARILPVADAHADYAHATAKQLRSQGLRVDVVDADETLGNRIRKAKGEKLPYVLVVGDDDVAAGTVGVNARGKDVERDVPVTTFAQRVVEEISAHTFR
ncbi:MAG: threonine--tRNA ligase [Actinobacteria bacterium]|nr:threonine--tRNA ligase [Actinomycetota bacterium]